MKKDYIKPVVFQHDGTVHGLPTVLAIGAVSAVAGAAAVALGKAVGDIVKHKDISNKEIKGLI